MQLFPHSSFDVVAIAASAGGVQALGAVLGALPADFPAPVIVAQHVSSFSSLPQTLERHTRGRILWAAAGGRARPGTILLVPPHVVLTIDRELRCSIAPVPSAQSFLAPDYLFESMAETCGARGIGVVLTGAGSAGARGALAIRRAGGVVIAQDAASSTVFAMPSAAIAAGAASFVLPLQSIPRALVALVAVSGGRDMFGIGVQRRRRTA